MKILMVADIHSNWPALQAVVKDAGDYDACLFLGDLVDYGTDPVPCVEWVRENAGWSIRGNHDHAVGQNVKAKGGNGFRELAAVTRPLQRELLSEELLTYLARLPVSQTVYLDGQRLFLVHATPRDPLGEYLLAGDVESWKSRIKDLEADLVCVGHSHMPFVLEFEQKKVLNPGSVGQPRDGDPRAAYAMIEDGRIELRRVEYDIDATLKQMEQRGMTARTLELTASVLKTGGQFPLKLLFSQEELAQAEAAARQKARDSLSPSATARPLPAH